MARRGDPQGPRARDLSARGAILALGLAAAAACASANHRVLQPLPEPVRRVSIAIDPVADVPQAELDGLAQALTKPLILAGVAVVPRGPGIPELLGHATDYRPDLHLTALWQVIGPDGATVGQCRTDFGVAYSLSGTDWGDVVQGTGAALAEFLAAR